MPTPESKMERFNEGVVWLVGLPEALAMEPVGGVVSIVQEYTVGADWLCHVPEGVSPMTERVWVPSERDESEIGVVVEVEAPYEPESSLYS
jgi:hypothetical protein